MVSKYDFLTPFANLSKQTELLKKDITEREDKLKKQKKLAHEVQNKNLQLLSESYSSMYNNKEKLDKIEATIDENNEALLECTKEEIDLKDLIDAEKFLLEQDLKIIDETQAILDTVKENQKECHIILGHVEEEITLVKEVQKVQIQQINKIEAEQKELDQQFEKIKINQHWQNHPLAMLLITPADQNKGIFQKFTDFLIGDFFDEIDKLRKSRKNAKGKNDDDFTSISLTYYSSLLIRIIEVVGEKQRLLKSPTLSEEEKLKIQSDIKILNQYFDQYMIKYKKTSTHQINFITIVKKTLCKSYIKPEKLEHQKRYADVGYSMGEQLKQFLSMPQATVNTDLAQFINQQISGFIKWADSHPRTAANMVGDMALTCSIIEDKSLIDTLANCIKSRAYALAFLDALGLCQSDEMIEDEEALKYRALADLTTYAPWVAATAKIVQHTFQANTVREWIFNVGKTLIKTKISKEVLEIVPPDHDKFVAVVIDIARGTEMQKILAYQRNLALIQIAGAVRTTLQNPVGTITYLKREIDIWWRSVWEAQGPERNLRIIVQLGIPAAGALLATAAIIAAISGVIFTYMNALAFALVITIASVTVARLLTTWINEQEEYKGTLESIYNQEVVEVITTKKTKEIHDQSKRYIEDLQKRCALPMIPAKVDIDQPEKHQIIDQLVNKYRQMLDLSKNEIEKNSSNNLMEAEEYVALFNKCIDLKEMKKELDDQIKANKIEPISTQTIVLAVADVLIKGWLSENLNLAFQHRLVALYQTTEDEYVKKLKQDDPIRLENVDEFIEEKIKTEHQDIKCLNNKEIRDIFDRFAKMSNVHAT